jgi:hypothetical protein
MRARFVKLLFPFGVAACATLGASNDGEENLPSAGVGPFRPLEKTELLDEPPLVVAGQDAQFRDPGVLALGEPGDLRAALYVVATLVPGRAAIVRTRAEDGRSFYGTAKDRGHAPQPVLAPDQPWEGDELSGPSALEAGGEVWLYYAAAGGIGRARSSDGLKFAKDPAPVLVADATVTWETSAPHAPSVVALPDGTFRMMYAAGRSIGEASSPDGVHWRRLDAEPSTPGIDPVLSPGPIGSFDSDEVTDPVLLPRTTAGGRLAVRVIYAGYAYPEDAAAGRSSTIGVAARYGDSGPLVRGVGPVYSAQKHEAHPAILDTREGTFLYVDQDVLLVTGAAYRSIAAALSTARLLPTPAAFADGP